MLKDLFSLLTIIALLFSSCSKSDEEENGDEPQPTKQTAYFGVNLSGAEFGDCCALRLVFWEAACMIKAFF